MTTVEVGNLLRAAMLTGYSILCPVSLIIGFGYLRERWRFVPAQERVSIVATTLASSVLSGALASLTYQRIGEEALPEHYLIALCLFAFVVQLFRFSYKLNRPMIRDERKERQEDPPLGIGR